MDCGDAGHILASQSVAEVLGQLSDWKEWLHDLGEAEVKHAVRIHLYNLCTREMGNAVLPQKLNTGQKTVSEVGADPNRLRDDRDLSRIAANSSAEPARKGYVVLAACVALLAMAFAVYYSWPRPKIPSQPTRITRISQWNKPMNYATLSPDGHTVAFVSPVGDFEQVFLMLTSGGDPLQLTKDEGDKWVDAFSPDGKEIYYERFLGHNQVWAVPTLGGSPRGTAFDNYIVPSPDGAFVYYAKSTFTAGRIFRAEQSGLNEKLVYDTEDTGGMYLMPKLVFPGGNELLVTGWHYAPSVRILRINLATREAVELGQIPGIEPVWAEAGRSLLFSRTLDGLTNIWNYDLKDRSLRQITFGTGPDVSPMPDPKGDGVYYVNGKSSAFLTAYHIHSRVSTDISSENATQPIISRDGKRVMYITLPEREMNELWVSDTDGGNKVRIATGEALATGTWALDSSHLSFSDGNKAYIVGPDGSGLRQLPQTGDEVLNSVWSADQKFIYVTGTEKRSEIPNVWKLSVSSSTSLERFADNCGVVSDADSEGKYLLGVISFGEKTGIYEVSISDKKCFPLLPGVVTSTATFARDGKSFLYPVVSHGEVTIYRQPWTDGKSIGAPQAALKVPFVFPLVHGGGYAYDFTRDLSTVVYARSSGHADLFLLNQK